MPVLSKIENNQTGISFETAMKIMGSLSLTLDELTGVDGVPPPPSPAVVPSTRRERR